MTKHVTITQILCVEIFREKKKPKQTKQQNKANFSFSLDIILPTPHIPPQKKEKAVKTIFFPIATEIIYFKFSVCLFFV